MSWLGAHRIDLDACGSTNDEAARLARAGARHGTVVIARSQHAGRGREGRAWQSPDGLGVYLSAIVRVPLALVDVPPMTLAIGIGLVDAIRASGAHAELKWPNDALVGGKKIAGVLVEAQSQGARLESIVIGIGVNLAGALPDAVADTATTLEAAVGEAAARSGAAGPRSTAEGRCGESIDRDAFIARLLAHVARWVDRYVAMGLAEIIPAWHERMARGLVARATVGGAAVVGVLDGLAEDGAVLVRDADGVVHRVRSGDVEVIRPTLLAREPVGSAAANVLPPAP